MPEEEAVSTDNQVLSACFSEPGAIARFAEEIENQKDVGYVHGFNGIYELFKAMVNYHRATDVDIVDPIAFQDWLGSETDLLDSMGGPSGFKDLHSQLSILERPDTDSLIKLVKFKAKKRRQLDHAQALQREISKSGMSEDNQMRIAALTEQISGLFQDLNYNPLERITTANDVIANLDELWDVPPFLPTPYPSLNRAMGYTDEGGFFRGGVHAIVAMSGMGKSTLAKCLMNYWLDTGYSVLKINFEEPKAHWNRVLMTQITGVNVYAEHQKLKSDEITRISRKFVTKLEEWGDRMMVRHDPETLFFEDLETWLRDIMGTGVKTPDVVIIDTIQSMFSKTGGKARWNDYEQMMVRLEKLAKEMDAVFIITAQQNSNALKEKREEINQGDMGGSLTIIQKSTVALFLVPLKGSEGEFDAVDSRIMQIQMPKNRITGTVFTGSPPLIEYRDDIKSYVPYDPGTSDPRYNVEEMPEDRNFDIT